MIEITPILTTPPIPKIKKIIRDGQKPDDQKQLDQKDKDSKDDDSNEQAQHIDEIV